MSSLLLTAICLWGRGHEREATLHGFLLFVAVVCSILIWRRVHYGTDLDPTRVNGAYVASRAWVVYVWGLSFGAVGIYRLLSSEQRHLIVVPEVWLTVLVGLGTGAAGLWALMSRNALHDWTVRQLAVERREQSEQVGRSRRHKAQAELAERCRRWAFDLDTLASSNRGSDDVVVASAMRWVGAGVARGYARLTDASIELDAHEGLAEDLEALCKDASTREASDEDALRRRVVERFIAFYERLSPWEDAGSVAPNAAQMLPRWSLTQEAPSRLEAWFRDATACESVSGPRVGTLFALQAGYIALLVLLGWELPPSGVSWGATMTWLFLPFTGLAVGIYWLSRQWTNSRAILRWNVAYGVVILSLNVGWWMAFASTYTGDVSIGQVIFMGWVLALGFAPVGAWLQNTRETATRVEVGHALSGLLQEPPSRDLHRWRGRRIVDEWTSFYGGVWVQWLNRIQDSIVIEQGRFLELLRNHRDAACSGKDLVPSFQLLKAARAYVDAGRLAQSMKTLSQCEHLLGGMDDEIFERYGELLTRQEQALERWFEEHELQTAVEVAEATVYAGFSREALYPPKMRGVRAC